MILKSLALKQYRSYERLGLHFDDGINILQGQNAAGKTNVLEAIGFLSFGKSFRTNRDTECIRDGAEAAYIKGTVSKKEGALSIEAQLSRTGVKSLKVDAQPIRRMGDLFGNFIAVIFAPEDLKVLKESPSLRRRFLDMEISKLYPTYFFDLQEYQKALAQKNALLKSRMKEEQLKKLVDIYNTQMSEHGERIIRARQKFIGRIDALSRDIHDDLSGGEALALKYMSSVSGDDIKKALFERMEKSLGAEIEQGCSLVGPHREDIAVSLGGVPVKVYASQGQIRTAMLSLKLATLALARTDYGARPVLLLDDVFSELDGSRQKALLHHVGGIQCFITTAVPVKNAPGCVFTVADGQVTMC